MTKLCFGLSAVTRWRKATLLCGVAMTLAASPVMAETLTEAMSLAYDTNPNLQAARAQLRATDEGVAIAASGWRPTVSVNGNVSRQRTDNIIPGAATTGTSTPSGGFSTLGVQVRTQEQVQAQITQPLFRGFKTVAGVSQAKNQVTSQRARLAATEAQVLLQVATAYLDVIQNVAVVELNRNQVLVLSRQLEATQDRFRVGEITRTDVAQSEASLAGAKASMVQAEGALQQARAAYLNVVGKAPETLTPPTLPGNLPLNLDDAVARAINENPAYLAADYSARAQQDAITVVRGDLLPSANLVGQYTRGWNTLATNSRAETIAGQAQVTVPLYQAGAEWARLRQAQDTYGQFRLLADQARLDARATAITAWESLQASTASQVSIRSQIGANEIALEGTQREAEVGSRTVLDVLVAEQTLLNSRVNLVRNQHDQQVAAYQLLSAQGKLTAGDLGLGVKLYDADTHYKSVKSQPIGGNSAASADAKR